MKTICELLNQWFQNDPLKRKECPNGCEICSFECKCEVIGSNHDDGNECRSLAVHDYELCLETFENEECETVCWQGK